MRFRQYILYLPLLTLAAPSHAVTFDWATIGNLGNAADPETDYGSVSYTYRISKHEVTNAQYVAFLNAVAANDTNGLYDTIMSFSSRGGITRSGLQGSYSYSVKTPAIGQGPGGSDYTYDNKPVNYVSFFDAMRFVNWLENVARERSTFWGAGTRNHQRRRLFDQRWTERNTRPKRYILHP